jgi:hypothetical protein
VRGGGAAAAAATAAAAGPPAPLAWTWHAAAAPTAHTLRGLAPDSVLLLRVRAAISTAAPTTTHRTASHEYTTTRRTTRFVPPAPPTPVAGAVAATAAAAVASSFDGALVLRTLRDDGTLYTTAFRISEYQFNPDFLANHDAASVEAMPVYIMDRTFRSLATSTFAVFKLTHSSSTCFPPLLWKTSDNPINTTDISPHWDGCQAALPAILGEERHGTGLACLDYAHSAAKYEQVAAVCGDFSAGDDSKGWDVHWWCGTGWPESVVMSSPITQYCVEHAPAPAAPQFHSDDEGDGFADYLSCNGDEVDPWGNAPRDPSCICNVWMDRMISQQPRSRIEAQYVRSLATSAFSFSYLPLTPPLLVATRCGLLGVPGTATEAFVGGEVQCNCSGAPQYNQTNPAGAVFLQPADPSNSYVGRAPVVLPYLYYVRANGSHAFARDPLEVYPVSVPNGHNYVFPKGGACAEGEAPTTAAADGGGPGGGPGGGCRWSRHAPARVFWGDELANVGWNFSWVQDTPSDMSHTLANIARFKRLVADNSTLSVAGKFLAPRCCGC